MSAPVMPPEQKFWQRYSPHNELPLSGVGTLTVYVLLGLLLLGGVQLSLYLTPSRDFAVGAVEPGFGEGDEAAVPGGSAPREAIEPLRIEKPTAPTSAAPSLTLPPGSTAAPEPAPPKSMDDAWPEITNDLRDRFAKVGSSIPGILRGPPGGEQQPGNPGGPKQGQLDNKPRVAAMQRWNMVFDTKNGDDYRKQLEALSAILAIPGPDGQYLVIRNLTPPVKPAAEDLQKLQRIFWVDDNAQSVRNLATALKLAEVPPHVVAFFPPELEQKLTALEKKFAGNRPVANVKETRFRILLNKQGAFEPVVVDQR